jgi:flagellin
MTSVNTNYGALVALQSLNHTTKELASVQNRVNTGLKVSSAKDNGAVFAIAEGQRVRVASIGAVRDGIDRATSVIDVGLSAGEAIGDILKQLKEKAVAGQATDLSQDQRDALEADFTALRNQINQIANAATFNGSNLVNGTNLTAGATPFTVKTSDASGSGGTAANVVTGTGVAGAIANINQAIDAFDPSGDTDLIAAGDTITFTTDPGDANEAVFNIEFQAGETIGAFLTRVGTETGGIITGSFDDSTGEVSWSSSREFDVALTIASTDADGAAFFGDTLSSAPGAGGGGGGTTSLTVSGFNFTLGAGAGQALNGITTGLTVADTTSAAAAATAIDTAITALNKDLATLGAQAKALDVQKTFLGKLSDSIEAGIGNLVDADLAKESARLQALQVKQQLGAQAWSIATAAPSIVLWFFR